ncbi:SEL1-like repeat protein [Entomomonas moraniae]|nr:SEL1-like repeat protein [Entomomonas moraniae]
MRRVAHLYLRNKTIKRNPELAKKWLTKSAELGDEEAKKTLNTENLY